MSALSTLNGPGYDDWLTRNCDADIDERERDDDAVEARCRELCGEEFDNGMPPVMLFMLKQRPEALAAIARCAARADAGHDCQSLTAALKPLRDAYMAAHWDEQRHMNTAIREYDEKQDDEARMT